ncbi:MAG: TIGR03617 family F420-dependent LLM class oxidoreductase [Microthrixaceae bacterium]
MHFDVMAAADDWGATAKRARELESVGISGMVFTETGQTPWMAMAAAAGATTSLHFSTGVAVAFPRSPMVTASLAWELAGNTGGRFRLGLGSQVRAHVERRYGAEFDPPGPRMADYLEAVRACLAAFRGDAPLAHDGPFYKLSLLPPMWRPRPHEHGEIDLDVSAVGPWMTRMAGELADGVHVHPLHSIRYLEDRLEPAVAEGESRAGRKPGSVDLLVPVFIVPGDSHEQRAELLARARTQIAFYGSTRNYAFQFDDLGFEGTSARLNEHLKAGDLAAMAATITDEMLGHFAVVGTWDDVADQLRRRYSGRAERVISYLTEDDLSRNPENLGRWGELARAVRGG